MVVKHKFREVSLVKNGLVFTLKSNTLKDIPISELIKLHIKANKIRSEYGVLYVLSSILIILFLYSNAFDITLVLSVILIVIIGIKLKNHKSYELKIITKNGDVFTKKISEDSKYTSLDLINRVRKEIFDYEIKK
jgi:hypothetical protein